MAAGLGELASMVQKGAGFTGNMLGGIATSIGAAKQAKEAKKQMQEGKAFGDRQLLDLKTTYGSLLDLAGRQETYKGDTSLYETAANEAKAMQKESQSVNPADQIYRDQARRSSANYINAASRGAGSGADLMAIAGMASNQENSQIQAINAQSANQAFNRRQTADQMRLSSLSQLAAASARERGMEFESRVNKQQNVLGLTKEAGLNQIDAAYQAKQDEFARRAAYKDSVASMYSGIGDAFRSIGGGIAQQNMQNQQMDMFSKIYGIK